MTGLRRAATVLLFASAFLALSEGVLTIAGAGGPDRLWHPHALADGTVRWAAPPPGKPPGPDDPGFVAEKPQGSKRLFFFGGSTVAGFPFPAPYAFPALLGHALEIAFPGKAIEIVNGGGIAVPLRVVAARLRESLAHEPDLVVVLSGHNEFLPWNPDPVVDRLRRPFGARLRQGLSELRTAGALRALLRKWRPPPPRVPMGLDEMARYSEPENKRAILDNYVRTYADLAAETREAGVPLVVVVPPANLADFAPHHSRPGALAPAGADAFARALARGEALLAEGEAAEALSSFEQAVSLDPGHAGAQYRLGRALLALDRIDEAHERFEKAREVDAAPVRILPSFETALRDLCAREGVPLVDAPAVLAGPRGIPDWTYFTDHCHPTPEGHRRIARELLRVLGREGLLFPKEAWPDRALDFAFPEPGPEERLTADGFMAQFLFPAALRMEEPSITDRAIACLRPVVEAHPEPGFALARLYLGVLLFRRGHREEAAPHLRFGLAHASDEREFHDIALQTTGIDRARVERMLREAEEGGR